MVLLSSMLVSSQNYYDNFLKYQKEGDTLSQRELLEKWRIEKPNDPELYTSSFNYLFEKSMQEVVELTTEEPSGDALVIQDSTDNVKGYLGSKIIYNDTILEEAINAINRGIQLFPDRLDMRFGKMYVLKETKQWDGFAEELISVLERSKLNSSKWTWTLNDPQEGKDFMLETVQSYLYQMFNTEELHPTIRELSKTILEYYPESVESLSNISVTFLFSEEYDLALEPLLKAESIDAKDHIVLLNIAYVYKMTGDKENAIKYYSKVKEVGDDQAKEYASKEIEELNKL
jgi:tetratricopeptide (TPR) repeat protein